tara:strand:- start:1013 stop:1216 length:204 start_codon:yes stop_codon:yes gene_type:complete
MINRINEFSEIIRKQIEDYNNKEKLVQTTKYNCGYDKNDLKEEKKILERNKIKLNNMINKYLNSLTQ